MSYDSSDGSAIPNVTLDINDDISIVIEKDKDNDFVANGINSIKGHLDTAIVKLCDTIDRQNEFIVFLKEELEEKNLLIRALTIRDANIGSFIFEEPNHDSSGSSHKCSNSVHVPPTQVISESVVEVIDGEMNCTGIDGESSCSENTAILDEQLNSTTENEYETIEYQLKNYRATQAFKHGLENANKLQTNFYGSPTLPNKEDSSQFKFAHKITWEKHSSGLASKILNKMGYKDGKRLGKEENGIKEPIEIAKTINRKKNNDKCKLMYILSDSMLKEIDPKRLGNERLVVKKFTHGGCKIKCMYQHLPKILKENPDFILLHVATNNCVDMPSDEIIKELGQLKIFILRSLPSCKTYFSLPTIRTDNRTANTIIRNLNLKLKKMNHFIMDNSNILVRHIGRKGLHFNIHGVRKMASNIISFIQYL